MLCSSVHPRPSTGSSSSNKTGQQAETWIVRYSYLLLGVELDCTAADAGLDVPSSRDSFSPLAVEAKVAQNTGLVAAPREHRERDRDRAGTMVSNELSVCNSGRILHVDSDLSNVDVRLELARSRAGLVEDGRTVTILVRVDDLDGFAQGISAKND